jgi:hypothetical protein
MKQALTYILFLAIVTPLIMFCYNEEQKQKKRAEIEDKEYWQRSYANKFQPDSLEWTVTNELYK